MMPDPAAQAEIAGAANLNAVSGSREASASCGPRPIAGLPIAHRGRRPLQSPARQG